MTLGTLSVALSHCYVIGHLNFLSWATRLWGSLLNKVASRSLFLLRAWVFRVSVRLKVSVHTARLAVLLLESFWKRWFRTATVSIWSLGWLRIILALVCSSKMVQMRLLEIARWGTTAEVRLIHDFYSMLGTCFKWNFLNFVWFVNNKYTLTN